jgi:hypothetical protein
MAALNQSGKFGSLRHEVLEWWNVWNQPFLDGDTVPVVGWVGGDQVLASSVSAERPRSRRKIVSSELVMVMTGEERKGRRAADDHRINKKLSSIHML